MFRSFVAPCPGARFAGDEDQLDVKRGRAAARAGSGLPVDRGEHRLVGFDHVDFGAVLLDDDTLSRRAAARLDQARQAKHTADRECVERAYRVERAVVHDHLEFAFLVDESASGTEKTLNF